MFDQLEVTRHHTGSFILTALVTMTNNNILLNAKLIVFALNTLIPGLVLFLEEDHYVAEDFLYLLELMQKRANELCAKCNILSLGTYLKTFNYYTYAQGNKVISIV